jgi:Ca-activated chloride channel family protein
MLPLNKRILTVILSIFSLAAAALWAEQQNVTRPPGAKAAAQSDQTEDSGAIFRSDTRVVVCPTTVVDKDGHLVTNLPKSAFTVYEDKEPQKFTMKREDVPVSLGLIVDNSGSMREKRKKVETAALDLVVASNKDDEVFVVNFNDSAYLDLPHEKDFTNDIEEMKEALARIDARGGTAMRDALNMSIVHLKEKAHRDKRVLVVVTDGVDNSSIISLEALVKVAQQSGVLVYAVGLLSDEDRRDATRAKRELDSLTEATGGRSFFPKELTDVDRIAQEVARDIRNQYTIAYSPTNAALDGTFRAIKITVNAPGHPTVRTRTGYYATPDQAQINKPAGASK